VARCAQSGVWRVDVHRTGSTVVGTAFAIRSDRTGIYLVTTAHLVQGAPARQVTLTSPDGKRHFAAQAEVLGKGRPGSGTDLAVLRIQPGGYPVLPWGLSTPVQVGRQVASLRYVSSAPTGLNSSLDTVRVVERDVHDGLGRFWLAHGTALHAGLLDGPVVALNGTVIGVNERTVVGAGVLAIPASQAKAQTDRLMASFGTAKFPGCFDGTVSRSEETTMMHGLISSTWDTRPSAPVPPLAGWGR